MLDRSLTDAWQMLGKNWSQPAELPAQQQHIVVCLDFAEPAALERVGDDFTAWDAEAAASHWHRQIGHQDVAWFSRSEIQAEADQKTRGHVYLPALIPHVLHRDVEGDGQEYHEHTEDRHWIHVKTSVCWEQMTEILKNDKKHMFYLNWLWSQVIAIQVPNYSLEQ